MMKKTINVIITIDTESGRVTALDITEGYCNRSEFVAEGVDDPVSIDEAMDFIRDELEIQSN